MSRPLLQEQYLKDNKKAFLRVFKKCGENLDAALEVILGVMVDDKAAATARMAAARTIISLTEQGNSTMQAEWDERLEGKANKKAKAKEAKLLKDNPELAEDFDDNVIDISYPKVQIGE
jgi:hypothetical protein